MPESDARSTALALSSAPTQAIEVLRPLSDEDQRVVDALKERPRSPATIRAYQEDWRCFTEWCSKRGQQSFPANEDTIIAFLGSFGLGARPATLRRRVATIRIMHRGWGAPLPTLYNVQTALENIKRGRTQQGLPNEIQKRALVADEIIEATRRLPKTLVGVRDRAVLLFGWAIGQRRADIAALRVEDVRPFEGGLYVTIPRSKTDQSGKTHTVSVLREGGVGCPVAALEAWLEAADIQTGPLMRRFHRSGAVDRRALSGHAIGIIVKQAAKLLGYDAREYGGHSLRRGFVTTADRAGRSMSEIMDTTGHRELKTVRKYVERSPNPMHAAGRGLLKVKEPESEPRETTEAFGQTLVKVTRFERAGRPYDARKQAALLIKAGKTRAQAVEALARIGVTRLGRPIVVEDLA